MPADSYSSLASISTVFGGFALTFLGVLLVSATGRVVDWIVRCSAVATTAFTVSALGWSLWSAQAAESAARAISLSRTLMPLHRQLSVAFVAGVLLLFVSLALTGFVRSRAVGLFTTTVAIAGAVAAIYVLSFFVT
jgi:hypothetical protein